MNEITGNIVTDNKGYTKAIAHNVTYKLPFHMCPMCHSLDDFITQLTGYYQWEVIDTKED